MLASKDYQTFDLPLRIADYAYWLVWHARSDDDGALSWLIDMIAAP